MFNVFAQCDESRRAELVKLASCDRPKSLACTDDEPTAHPPGSGPPPGGELLYGGDASGSHVHVEKEPAPARGEDSPSPPALGNGPSTPGTNGKRKQPDSAAAEGSGRKRRFRASASGEDGGDGDAQDLDVGPNGGPKHWTEEEKTRFFTWMLTSDDHWEAFRTRMNTVFRECSNELFPGRKSYTALKSCFHRNLEVYKQIHAFQLFSANQYRQMQVENPNAERSSVDTMLEAARVAGLNVGSLNVKVIDRWYETGWYHMFKKRYREDPKTGLPVPYYGSIDEAEAGPSILPTTNAMMGLHTHTSIDPQLVSQQTPLENAPAHHGVSPEPPPPSTAMQSSTYSYSSPVPQVAPEYRQTAQPSTSYAPSTYLRSANAAPPRALPPPSPAATARSPSRNAGASVSRSQNDMSFRRDQPSPSEQYAQTAQALTQLNVVTETLLGVCSSLKGLIEQQAEESRARTELLRAEVAQRQQSSGITNGGPGKEYDKEISIEKVTFATEILKNGPENEDIKKAAIECLTKYLMRGL
ncbi:hypothetical protein BD413DRAFT_494060 [Trametes elegans]|nr:hypothetical protein BD413DRAFT_494060 [Trametes elegans]